jgi:hypothetical protein
MNAIVQKISEQSAAALQNVAWLRGQPSLEDYIAFVRSETIDGEKLARSALVDEWRLANDYYHELETSEAGLADTIQVREPNKALRPAITEMMADRRFCSAFDAVPTAIKMVELDKLIVSQSHIDVTHTARIQQSLGSNADPVEVLRFCQRLDADAPPVRFHKSGRNRYTFSSASSDFRFHGATVLRAAQITGDEKIRSDAMILGLMLGFSSNFLSVIASDDRVVLYNGHHRAYALRALGYTHAPCVVQTVTRRDELNLIASGEITDSPALYFLSARPPLLKDFFDSRIRKIFDVKPVTRVIELNFDIREFEVAD